MKQPRSAKSKLDLVTHPVRLRILMALMGVERTPQQITALLDDVPASSIYRHLQMLLDAGLIEVSAERRVRGAVEKTLRVATGAAMIDPDEARLMSADDHRRALLVFFTQLFHEFDQYVRQPQPDFMRDLVGYRAVLFYASDEEWLAAIQAMNAALLPLFANEPGAGRTRRRLATVTLPIVDQPEETIV